MGVMAPRSRGLMMELRWPHGRMLATLAKASNSDAPMIMDHGIGSSLLRDCDEAANMYLSLNHREQGFSLVSYPIQSGHFRAGSIRRYARRIGNLLILVLFS